MIKDIKFPLFRKLSNGKAYYRVDSRSHMTELQWIGKKLIRHDIDARILPERNLIADVISNEGNRWVEITEKEYNQIIMNLLN